MNGFWLVTSADTNRVGSISQREPVGTLGSGTGRKALGNTSALMPGADTLTTKTAGSDFNNTTAIQNLGTLAATNAVFNNGTLQLNGPSAYVTGFTQNLAGTIQGSGRFAEAEREYQLALNSARQLKSPLLEARILTNLADTQLQLGRTDQALATLDSANALVQRGEGAGWRPFVFGVRAASSCSTLTR